MRKPYYYVFWFLPFIIQSNDVNAWGLVTHLYFAHSLLWAMPLLDPRLRKAIENFPELVMAGACIPDLAVISTKFSDTHRWQHAHDLIERAQNEKELAIAIGYASHLYIDVIAHNHFVPAHEEMWWDKGMMAHIASEWAMDAHLSPLLNDSPKRLLTANLEVLTNFIAPQFNRTLVETKRAILKLSFWDMLLRTFKIPHIIYQVSKVLDKRVHQHFIYYIAKTQSAILDIEIVLSGIKPAWEAELVHLSASQLSAWRLECLGELALLHPAPIQYFVPSEY